jgi:hypothetical protein
MPCKSANLNIAVSCMKSVLGDTGMGNQKVTCHG